MPFSSTFSRNSSLQNPGSFNRGNSNNNEPPTVPPRRWRRGRSLSQTRAEPMIPMAMDYKLPAFGYDRDAFAFNYINGLIKPLRRHLSSDISFFKTSQSLSRQTPPKNIFSLPTSPQPEITYPMTPTSVDFFPFGSHQETDYPLSPPPYDDETEVKHIWALREGLISDPRRNFSNQLSLEQREQLEKQKRAEMYSILKEKVDEKYFNKTVSMDSIFIRKIRPSHSLPNSPSNEQIFQQIVTQQRQIHSLNEQQQFLQQFLITQQQQQQIQQNSPGHYHHHHRSRHSLPEDQENKKIAPREKIREQLHKQQQQVAEHIKQLNEQLNVLMERRAQRQQQHQSSFESENIDHSIRSTHSLTEDTTEKDEPVCHETARCHSSSPETQYSLNEKRHPKSSSDRKFVTRSSSSPNIGKKTIATPKVFPPNYFRRASSDESVSLSSSEFDRSEDEIDFSNQTVIPLKGIRGSYRRIPATGNNDVKQKHAKKNDSYSRSEQEEKIIALLRQEEEEEKADRLRSIEMREREEEEKLRMIEMKRINQEELLRETEHEMMRQQEMFMEQQTRLLEQQKQLKVQKEELQKQQQLLSKKDSHIPITNTFSTVQHHIEQQPVPQLSTSHSRSPSPNLTHVNQYQPRTLPHRILPQISLEEHPHSREETHHNAEENASHSVTDMVADDPYLLKVPHHRRNTNELFLKPQIGLLKPTIEKPKRKYQLDSVSSKQPETVTTNTIQQNDQQTTLAVPSPPNRVPPPKPARRKSLIITPDQNARSREPTPTPFGARPHKGIAPSPPILADNRNPSFSARMTNENRFLRGVSPTPLSPNKSTSMVPSSPFSNQFSREGSPSPTNTPFVTLSSSTGNQMQREASPGPTGNRFGNLENSATRKNTVGNVSIGTARPTTLDIHWTPANQMASNVSTNRLTQEMSPANFSPHLPQSRNNSFSVIPTPEAGTLEPPNLPPRGQRSPYSTLRQKTTDQTQKASDQFADHFEQYVSPKAKLKPPTVTRENSKASSDEGITFTVNPRISHSTADFTVTEVWDNKVNLKSDHCASTSALTGLNDTSTVNRRQTLPDVIANNETPINNVDCKLERRDLRKKSMPGNPTSTVPPPEGWEREKVAAMAHEIREERIREALNPRRMTLKSVKDWIVSRRLMLIVLAVNFYLAYYFYSLFQPLPNSDP